MLVPEYIYDETCHAADVSRNVLVLDNLEEKRYYPAEQGAHYYIKSMSYFKFFCTIITSTFIICVQKAINSIAFSKYLAIHVKLLPLISELISTTIQYYTAGILKLRLFI